MGGSKINVTDEYTVIVSCRRSSSSSSLSHIGSGLTTPSSPFPFLLDRSHPPPANNTCIDATGSDNLLATSRSQGPCHRHHRGNNPVWQKECCHRQRRGKKYNAAKKYNQKYDVRWGQQGTRETSPIPHHRCQVAMKLEKGRCLQRPQTYFAEGGEGGGGEAT